MHTTENCDRKLKLHIFGNPDRKEVEIMPHIILYELQIILTNESSSLTALSLLRSLI